MSRRPSKLGEVKAKAFHAGMLRQWNGSWASPTGKVRLHPAPHTRLLEREGEFFLLADSRDWELDTHPENDGLLSGFLQLAEASATPEDVLAYARRYGLLLLCEHGRPWTHTLPYCPAVCHREGEPVEAWFQLARRLRALLAVAAALREGKTSRDADFELAFGFEWPGDERWPLLDQSELAAATNELLEEFGATIELIWPPDAQGPQLAVAAHGLARNLARQTAFFVVDSRGLWVCTGCGRPYRPERKPRSENHYCPSCREDGTAARDRKRRQRARKREATG